MYDPNDFEIRIRPNAVFLHVSHDSPGFAIEAMGKMQKAIPKKPSYMVDIKLAHLAGARRAASHPDAEKRQIEIDHFSPLSTRRYFNHLRAVKIYVDKIHYLATGERGASADFLFSQLTNTIAIHLDDPEPLMPATEDELFSMSGTRYSAPRDFDDLLCCVQMVGSVSQARDELQRGGDLGGLQTADWLPFLADWDRTEKDVLTALEASLQSDDAEQIKRDAFARLKTSKCND
jgi:hypothetical protein